MSAYRWTPEALAEFEKRASGWRRQEGNVTTHVTQKPARVSRPSQKSELEGMLALQLKAIKAVFEPQHRPLPPRKWTLDFAIPERKLGIEVQGMVHRIKDRFKADIEKRAELSLAGWRILEVDGESIRDGRALAWIERLLK